MIATRVSIVIALILFGTARSIMAQVETGEDYRKAQGLLRDLRTNTDRPSARDSSRTSDAPSDDDRRSSRNNDERNRRNAERERQRAASQQERLRIENNFNALDAWLVQASTVQSSAPSMRSSHVDLAAINLRRRKLATFLTLPTQPQLDIEIVQTTVRGAALDAMLEKMARSTRARQIRDAVAANRPIKISIAASNAQPDPKPFYYRPSQEEVTRFDGWIQEATRKSSIDPDLVRAIIWLETTHGWYDRYVPGEIKSIRPMNVYVNYWSGLGVSRQELQDPYTNIETGVRILEGLWKNVETPSIEKVATAYNNLAAEQVSSYGKTAAYYYQTKPWLQKRPR